MMAFPSYDRERSQDNEEPIDYKSDLKHKNILHYSFIYHVKSTPFKELRVETSYQTRGHLITANLVFLFTFQAHLNSLWL